MSRTAWIGAALVALVAALSLFLPYMPVYDPWGWLVWGRELARLDLATGAGPSWKPLPVLIDAPLSLFGGAAPRLWLFVARAGWLLAPLLAGALAWRLGGAATGRWRWLAVAVAAASVGLSGDAFTPPVRQLTGGLSEPLLVSLVLCAVWLALDRRPRGALWLGVAASLLRPECWIFLAVWAWREVRRDPALRPHAIAAALLIPLAWFVPDLLATGNALEGSETARQGGLELDEVPQVLGRALAAPLGAVWIGIAFLIAGGRRRVESDGVLTVLLLAALAWVGLVAAMAVAGYAGLPRFLAPASAIFSIVGAVGLARGGAFAHDVGRRGMAVAVVVASIVALAGFGLRLAEVPGDVETIAAQTRSQEDLFELADRVGVERLLSCGREARVTQLLAQTALAWKLDVQLESIRVRRRPQYGAALSTKPLEGKLLDRFGVWRATQLPC